QRHPDVELHFTDWNCYHSDPVEGINVFVFESTYLTSFAEKGYLLPIPEDIIKDRDDIFPYTIDGCYVDGTLYALPQLLCADFLFTRKGDGELAVVTDIEGLYRVLGARKEETVIPGENEGLLADPSNKARKYLDVLTDEQQKYSDYGTLPDVSDLSAVAVEKLRELRKMSGEELVRYLTENKGKRALLPEWFADGKGRAFIGYSESMALMGDAAGQMDIRLFSYSDRKNIPVFYTDLVGISAEIDEERKELAYELANILLSEEVLTKMSMPGEEGGSPQYLLTVRSSVYDHLEKEFPIYAKLKEIVENPDNHVFRAGSGVREFIKAADAALTEALTEEELAAAA
ncbi:MAG: thiamine pyridinylase, partial [Lachnospiraceae bacterium]|nr:thiamine pyridinylase [Lachnospiraceae bacterium]